MIKSLLQELLEPPIHIKKEMPIIGTSTIGFYSEDTIKRDFEIVGTMKDEDKDVWVLLNKNLSFGVIGILSFLSLTLSSSDNSSSFSVFTARAE